MTIQVAGVFQFDLYPTGVTVGDEFGKSVSVYSNVYVAGAPGYKQWKRCRIRICSRTSV